MAGVGGEGGLCLCGLTERGLLCNNRTSPLFRPKTRLPSVIELEVSGKRCVCKNFSVGPVFDILFHTFTVPFKEGLEVGTDGVHGGWTVSVVVSFGRTVTPIHQKEHIGTLQRIHLSNFTFPLGFS